MNKRHKNLQILLHFFYLDHYYTPAEFSSIFLYLFINDQR
jgi:hypothetical protein